MRTRSIAVACVTSALIVPALALAGTNTLKGSLSETTAAAGSKVTIKVETNAKGVATKVSSFTIANAQGRQARHLGRVREQEGPQGHRFDQR